MALEVFLWLPHVCAHMCMHTHMYTHTNIQYSSETQKNSLNI